MTIIINKALFYPCHASLAHRIMICYDNKVFWEFILFIIITPEMKFFISV